MTHSLFTRSMHSQSDIHNVNVSWEAVRNTHLHNILQMRIIQYT